IAPDGSLLVRQGDDVAAYRPDSLAVTGRVKGGGTDQWILTGWRPRGSYRSAFAEAAVPSGQPGAAVAAGAATGDSVVAGEGLLYVQVSTSQNEAWSSEMAQQLSRAGLTARVLAPHGPDDGYRVVLGPYPTRAKGSSTRSSTAYRSPRRLTRWTTSSSSLRARTRRTPATCSDTSAGRSCTAGSAWRERCCCSISRPARSPGSRPCRMACSCSRLTASSPSRPSA